MKAIPHLPALLGPFASIFLISSSHAAFIVEPNGKAMTNYSAGTTAGTSTTAGSGILMAPGLTFGAASVYGGEPYTYTYTLGTDTTNTTFSSATVLNSAAGLFASGLVGGGVGKYNIYHVFPGPVTGLGGQPTKYDLKVNGISVASSLQDQNITNVGTGVGVGLWELVGQVTVFNPTDSITVSVENTTASNFVGVRTAGILFDYAGAVPEPSSALLLGMSALGLLRLRRR